MTLRNSEFWLDSNSLCLRPPALDAPPHSLRSFASQPITFRHPGYPDTHNLLFRIPAHDGWERPETTRIAPEGCNPNLNDREMDDWTGGMGIHHGTAVQACSIIACNIGGFLTLRRLELDKDEDYLSENQGGPSLDDILTSFDYYFYPYNWLDSHDPKDLKYPICPGFDHWKFPHDEVPDAWITVYGTKESSAPTVPPRDNLQALGRRDGTCRVTSFEENTQAAHLIPENKQAWFSRNGMHRYNLSYSLPYTHNTNDLQNLVLLRQDLCAIFATAPLFVFVPKCGSSEVHFLTPSNDYGRLYHNRQSEGIKAAPEFVYARFAWAVLKLVGDLACVPGVNVVVWSEEKREWVERVIEIGEEVGGGHEKKRKGVFGDVRM